MTGDDKSAWRPERVSEPTVLDVARAADVSKATAARALGGYGVVSESVRERVAAAAARLGYRPNRLARSMKSGRTRTIGVVVGDIQIPFFAVAVRAIADVMQAEGWEVILSNTNEDLAREQTAVSVLFENRVDGLVVAPASSEEGNHLINLSDRGMPIVLLDRKTKDLNVDAVVVDNAGAMEDSVRFLANLGHERVAVVGNTGLSALPIPGDPSLEDPREIERAHRLVELKPAIARFHGYFRGLRASGLPLDAELVRRAVYARESAAVQALAVVDRPNRATAIVTTDSLMTLGVLEAVRQTALRIPEDISLIGFDDTDWATVVVPAISVVAQPARKMGELAARRLLARIGGDVREPATWQLATRLVHRESTARLVPQAP